MLCGNGRLLDDVAEAAYLQVCRIYEEWWAIRAVHSGC